MGWRFLFSGVLRQFEIHNSKFQTPNSKFLLPIPYFLSPIPYPLLPTHPPTPALFLASLKKGFPLLSLAQQPRSGGGCTF